MSATLVLRAGRSVTARVRRMPFAVGIASILVVLALITGVLNGPPRRLTALFGTGYEPLAVWGHWWSPFSSLLFTRNVMDLCVSVLMLLLLVGMTERMIGTWRTVTAYVVTPVLGTVLGTVLQALASEGNEFWVDNVRAMVTFDPLAAVAGTVMAGSAFASVLVRRRIRVLSVLIVLMLLLYSGQPADLYRALAVGAGWLTGMAFRPPARLRGWARSSDHEIRVLLASAVAITAIGPALALFTRSRLGLLAPIALLLNNGASNPGEVLDSCQAFNVTKACVREITLERISGVGPVVLSILPLVTLLLVAYGLLRGRRFAVWLGVLMNGALALLAGYYLGFLPRSGLPQVVQRMNQHYWGLTVSLVASVLVPAAIAATLVLLRRRFPVLAPRSRVVGYALTVTASVVILSGTYVGFGWMLRHTGFTRPITIFDLMANAVERFLPVSFLHRELPDFLPITPLGWLLYHGVGPVFWCVVFAAAIPPMIGRQEWARGSDAVIARTILKSGGGDTLSFMTTWAGNSYWFDQIGDAAVAYRVLGGIALTTGGPFGSATATADIIAGFARFCDDNGWIPVFYSVEESLRPVFSSMGWSAMTVAEEAVVIPSQWQTTGKKWQDVRTSINRAARAGIRAEWTNYAALSTGTARQLAEISEQWVADKQLPEMGFTLGGLDELSDPDVALMLARDDHGVVQGVTSWLPCYRNGQVVGWTLDFMRRRAESMNGVMEFVIAEAAVTMRDDGIEFMSLSAAPLASTSSQSRPGSGAADRFLHSLGVSLEPVYGFRSLLAFKRKFSPQLHPLLMAYPDSAALPRIGLALLRAYLPGLSVRQVTRLMRGAP